MSRTQDWDKVFEEPLWEANLGKGQEETFEHCVSAISPTKQYLSVPMNSLLRMDQNGPPVWSGTVEYS